MDNLQKTKDELRKHKERFGERFQEIVDIKPEKEYYYYQGLKES